MKYEGIINRYRQYLEIPGDLQPITLFEGDTPLIPVREITKKIDPSCELWIKYEGLNPTGSFKDRGMTIAVSEAAHRGAKAVICASTGNTAASAAAYAARAGMRAIVIIPAGKVAAGKLAGALVYGAEVIQIKGSFDDALDLVLRISERNSIALVNSLNPFRLEGQKTAAFEICDTLECTPDWLALPVGNAGNITSYWMGFQQYHSIKEYGLPQILGVQAQGAAPLVLGHAVKQPETIATAIRIGKPARGEQALLAAEQSKGKIIAASDEEIIYAQKLLASNGIWVEPASAAGIAGLLKMAENHKGLFKNKLIVAICTGHGLKDPDIVTRDFKKPEVFPADLKTLEGAIFNG